MQLRTRRLAFLSGGALLATIGLTLAACSTDNGDTPVPNNPPVERDKTKDKDTDTDEDKDTDKDTDKDPKDAGAPDCTKAPKLRETPGVFCFGGAGADDAGQCSPAESKVCCGDAKGADGVFLKATCAVAEADPAGGYKSGACEFPADGTNGREWHCSEDSQCPGQGEACCVIKGTTGLPKAMPDTRDFPGCGTFFNSDQGFNVGGSRCRKTGCEAGELKLCSKDADCETGTCHPFKLANRYTGVCQ